MFHLTAHFEEVKGSFVYLLTDRSCESMMQETIAFPSGLKVETIAAAYIYKI